MDETTLSVIAAFRAYRDSVSEDEFFSHEETSPLLAALLESLMDLEGEAD